MANWLRIEIDVYYDEAESMPIDAEAQLRDNIERCILENSLLELHGDAGCVVENHWRSNVDDCGKG